MGRILLRKHKALKTGMAIAKIWQRCTKIYPKLGNRSVYWEILCVLEKKNMAICLRLVRLRKYRMYLKCLDRLPECVPHAKIKKTFISIHVRKHWVFAVGPQSPSWNPLDFYLSGTLRQRNLNAFQIIRNLPRTFGSLRQSMIRHGSTCWWRTFWAFAVNFDLINIKKLVVIK